MRDTTHESVFCLLLLAFFCWGLAGSASAIDSPTAPSGLRQSSEPPNASGSGVAAQLEYWPAKCLDLEKSGTNTDASRCWWYGAEALSRYATADRPLSEDLEAIRTDWLWRGVRLSLRVQETRETSPLAEPDPEGRQSSPVEPYPENKSPPAEPVPIARQGPDPARIAGPVSCASILLSDREKCLAATKAATTPEKKQVQPQKKKAAKVKVSKKKAAPPKVVKAKPKTKAALIVPKPPKKKAHENTAAHRENPAVPLFSEIPINTNFACPSAKPCIGRHSPTASLR